MIADMSAGELSEWRAFYDMTLPGTLTLEHYLGELCALVANAHFNKQGGGKFKRSDFAPDLRSPEERRAVQVARLKAQADFEEMIERARNLNEESEVD